MQKLPLLGHPTSANSLLDVSKLDECFVEDQHGQALSLKNIRKDYTCIIVFIQVSPYFTLSLYTGIGLLVW